MSQIYIPSAAGIPVTTKRLFLLGLLVFASVAFAVPYTPSNDSVVLEKLPESDDAVKREFRRLRRELNLNPDNLVLATRLAKRYITLGRAESDPRYYGYAQAALTPWWNLSKPPSEILLLRATLFQNRHDFQHALADLEKVLKVNPDNAQAWLTRAVILDVLGKYKEAMQSCMRLRNIASTLIRAACLSGVSSRNGQAGKSYKLLLDAMNRAPDADAGIQLWALTILAEIADSLGNTTVAEKHFRTALSLGIRDGYLLYAYADFLLDQDRNQEVLTLLADETRADGALLRVALAEQPMDAPGLDEHVALLNARFAESRLRGDRIHLREESRFTLHLLGKPDVALSLAKENWRLQREPWDARLVLETALATNASDEANAVMQWLKRSNLENKKIRALAEQFDKKK